MSSLLVVAWVFPLILAAGARHPRLWWTPGVGAAPALCAALLVPTDTRLELDWLLIGATFGLDEIGRIFLLFTSILWLAAGIYAAASMRGTQHVGRFNTLFLLAMAGNLWLITGQDLVSFYVGFALMGISSYGLVIHEGDPAALRAGKVYLVLTLAAEVTLFVALVMIASTTGSIQPTPDDLVDLDQLTIGLLILGLAVKAGLVPLHVWLPLAHPAAPIPASAVLSGAMIKVALLGWLRFLPIGEIALPGWGLLFVFAGLATALFAVPIGLVQSNPKVLLAYSSVSKMGLMVIILGLMLLEPGVAPAAAMGLALYAGHHALAKGGLFLGVGLRKSAGAQGLVFSGLLLLALSMAAVPLTGGAVAKYGIKPVFAEVDWAWLKVAIALTTMATAFMMARFLWSMWHLKRAYPGEGNVFPDPERIAGRETGGGQASKLRFVLDRAAQWALSATWPSVEQNQAGRPERGSVPKANWAAVGWVPLIALVVLYPMVLGSPEAWVTDAGLIGLAILLALPLILIAIRRPAAVAPLVDKIEPGDLLGLVRPVLLAGHLSLRWSMRAYRLASARLMARGKGHLSTLTRRPILDLDRRLTSWPLAGGLWLGITAGLIGLAMMVPTQMLTTPPVGIQEPYQIDEILQPDPAVLEVKETAEQPTLPLPAAPISGTPEDEVDGRVQPATTVEMPPEPADTAADEIESVGAPAEPEAASEIPACDPDQPYVFRHEASDRDVELARCVVIAGILQQLDAPPLSNELVLLIQKHLKALGYDAGPIDGLIGPRTRSAIRAFQADRGMEPTGAITFDLLDRIREIQENPSASEAAR
jgi:formate hydrogenlyase subunit 3/multisubunit Na+/H+ antiporter MnhD subunit